MNWRPVVLFGAKKGINLVFFRGKSTLSILDNLLCNLKLELEWKVAHFNVSKGLNTHTKWLLVLFLPTASDNSIFKLNSVTKVFVRKKSNK